MSLAVAIKAPEGLVLAADSRVTYTQVKDIPDPIRKGQQVRIITPITYDNATKLLSFDSHNYVGAVTYDTAEIGDRTANSYIIEFLAEIGTLKEDNSNRLSIKNFAQKLSDFYKKKWDEANKKQSIPVSNNMRFIVGGFDVDSPYAEVYEVIIPSDPIPKIKMKDNFLVLWGGQTEIIDRIFNAMDRRLRDKVEKELNLTPDQIKKFTEEQLKFSLPILARVLALKDCVKLALTMIRTTIDLQSLSHSQRTVGGDIDIATITKENGLQFIQKKSINIERENNG